MQFRKAQELERQGLWHQAIEQLIRIAIQSPDLLPIVALESDRLLRSNAGKSARLSFSRNGFSPSTLRWLKKQSWKFATDLFGVPSESQASNVIGALRADENNNVSGDALEHAFTRATGNEIEALDLLLARHFARHPVLRLRYVNRYLASKGQGIRLLAGSENQVFNRLEAKKAPLPLEGGPLVSVLMPVCNGEETLLHAARSILKQSWRPLELVLIDDASTDKTWDICRELAKEDTRVKVHRNSSSVGPYVSKNVGLQLSKGAYITSHHAKRWAFPDRISHQVNLLLSNSSAIKATCGSAFNIDHCGLPVPLFDVSFGSVDGFAELCVYSLMIERDHFRRYLGAWDNVRHGGGREMMDRAELSSGGVLKDSRIIQIALVGERDGSSLGVQVGAPRRNLDAYRQDSQRWHSSNIGNTVLPLWPKSRPFPVDGALGVNSESLKSAYDSVGVQQSSRSALARLVDPEKVLAEHQVALIKAKVMPKKPMASCVLVDANRMVPFIGHEAAIYYAERHLPSAQKNAIGVLRANASLERGDESTWLFHLSQYLCGCGLASLRLKNGDSLLARLSTDPLPSIETGPLVTIIMPAWNSQDTVEHAARSILNQTWRPIELIIVDDASDDNTWSVLRRLASLDKRVRILRNKKNVGPYVSKNIALTQARGMFVTGHDADDWAHPQRIEKHVQSMLASGGKLKATVNYMVRVQKNGTVTKIAKIGKTSFDGVARLASISCMFDVEQLRSRLGFWDSVRFAADSEMIRRAELCFGDGFQVLRQIGMICLDLDTSLTNHPVHGIRADGGGLAESRTQYRASWDEWHKANLPHGNPYLQFPLRERRYEAHPDMVVPYDHQASNIEGLKIVSDSNAVRSRG